MPPLSWYHSPLNLSLCLHSLQNSLLFYDIILLQLLFYAFSTFCWVFLSLEILDILSSLYSKSQCGESWWWFNKYMWSICECIVHCWVWILKGKEHKLFCWVLLYLTFSGSGIWKGECQVLCLLCVALSWATLWNSASGQACLLSERWLHLWVAPC